MTAVIVVHGPKVIEKKMVEQATAVMRFYEADAVYITNDPRLSSADEARHILHDLMAQGKGRKVVITCHPHNLNFGLEIVAGEKIKELNITYVFFGDVMQAMTNDLSKLEDRIIANMSSEQLSAMASNTPVDFYHPGVVTTEKADAILKQFRENRPEMARLWYSPRKAVLPRTTGYKMPARHARDIDMPTFATVFSGEDERSTLRIENGYLTEVEMSIDKPFTLRLVALLISHFDITPADIANETRLCGFDKEPGEA